MKKSNNLFISPEEKEIDLTIDDFTLIVTTVRVRRMTFCLMVYAGLEHQIRTKLKEKNLHFPNQKKKPVQNPTARWVFFSFMDISLLTINKEQKLVVNLKERHEVILNALGKNYRYFYS